MFRPFLPEEGKAGFIRTHPTHGPEEILVLTLIRDHDLAGGGHHLQLEHLVRAEPVLGAQETVAAAGQVATHADGLAAAADHGLVERVQLGVPLVHLGPGT